MALTGYRTVAQAAVDEFTEKRSRFIGAICPVSDEAQAQAFIHARQKEFWDARHNVYAYILDNGALCRFSDDGEPQGTAGMPALDVLKKEKLTDCAVVITRYFGGVLLGGGGLVRAYTRAAKLSVDAAGTVQMVPAVTGQIVCDYAQYGFVPALLAAAGGMVTDTTFAAGVTVFFSLPQARLGELRAALTERSAGQLTVRLTGEVLLPVPEKK